MKKINISIALIISFFMIPVLTGCLMIAERPESSYYRINKKYAQFRPDSFRHEIERLEEITANNAASPIVARAYLSLVLLHLDHKNPERSYQKARRALEKYVAAEPEGAKLGEVKNWAEALKDLEMLQREVDALAKDRALMSSEKAKSEVNEELKLLTEENRALRNAVDKLRGDIEKLSELDLELEKKRKINR